ncbi:MAG: hypothetical protein ACPLTR_02760 [Thermacetogeniaceae bacterium]
MEKEAALLESCPASVLDPLEAASRLLEMAMDILESGEIAPLDLADKVAALLHAALLLIDKSIIEPKSRSW